MIVLRRFRHLPVEPVIPVYRRPRVARPRLLIRIIRFIALIIRTVVRENLRFYLYVRNMRLDVNTSIKWIKVVSAFVLLLLLIIFGRLYMNRGFPFVKPEAKPFPLQASLTYNKMPHLMRHPKARSPALQILSPRRSSQVDVVIGIPTVKRDQETYLEDTVKSLIDGMTPKEQERTLIVIYIGEAEDLDYVVDTAYKINMVFEQYFGQLIEVISPTKYWYPKWDTIPAILGDSVKRTHWRAKHNLDAIFLMSYAQNKGTFYLMMEDDVVAKKDYMTEIMKFLAIQSALNPNWFVINFSTSGGIGKLFRSKDLVYFAAYVQVFYQYMPIDWLLELYLASRICGTDKYSLKCNDLKGGISPIYIKNLFEHVGLYSSLRGKIQNVKAFLKDDNKYKNFKAGVIKMICDTQLGQDVPVNYPDDLFWFYNQGDVTEE